MKTFLLLVMLFTFPWNKSNQPTEKVLAEGMYTYTGYIYSEKLGEQNSPCAATAYYIQIFESKIVQIAHALETYEEKEVTYTYQGTNSDGYRVYQSGVNTQFWVDANYDLVFVTISSSYGGHVQNYIFGQVIKGDHAQEFRQKCQQQMNDMPFFMD